MIDKSLDVGKELEAKCGKCKDVTVHVIVAMVEGKAKRVECRSCHAVHNYRAPGSGKKSPADPKKPRAPRMSKAAAAKFDDSIAVDYKFDGSYEAGQVLRHSTFGLGQIKTVYDTRITVLFSDRSTKMLVIKPKVKK